MENKLNSKSPFNCTDIGPSSVKVYAIAAVDNLDNLAIGSNNDLLFHNKVDMQWFKLLTTGHPVVMGANTLRSMGGPLKDRANFIVTRHVDDITANYTDENYDLYVHDNIDEIIWKAKCYAFTKGLNSIYIIGGASVYDHMLKNRIVDMIILTSFENYETNKEPNVFIDKNAIANYAISESIDLIPMQQNGEQGKPLLVYFLTQLDSVWSKDEEDWT